MATKRLKSQATSYASQNRESVQADIKTIGDLQREWLRNKTELDDAVAVMTQEAAPVLDGLQERIKVLQAGVQTWCEANREQLCGHGGKTATLTTGEVSWRVNPPSVRITGVGAVIETLKRLGLGKFIRTKDEVNKEAILNEPAQVKGVAGITVVTGVEEFVITPYETEVAKS